MSILLFALLGSLSLLGVAHLFSRMRQKAEDKAFSAQRERLIAAAKARAWGEDKQRFMH